MCFPYSSSNKREAVWCSEPGCGNDFSCVKCCVNQFASIQEIDNHITITWDCYKNWCVYVFLKTNTIYLLYETRSLISPVFPVQLGKTDWPASPGITHLCLLGTGVTSVCTYAHQFCIDSGDQTRVPVRSGHAFY